MTRYLLDTHVALWWALDHAQMSARHRQLIESGAGEFYISAVSCWETSIKAAQGKLRLDLEPLRFFQELVVHDVTFEPRGGGFSPSQGSQRPFRSVADFSMPQRKDGHAFG